VRKKGASSKISYTYNLCHI